MRSSFNDSIGSSRGPFDALSALHYPGVSGHSPTPSAGDFEALIDSGLPSRISHQSASKYWRMLKTKGHQVAAKFLRYWYTFTENFLVFFHLVTSYHLTFISLPLFPFLWGLHPISVRMEGPESKMYSPPEKRSGNDENDPMLTPHYQQISCRYIVYTYIFSLGCIPKLKSLQNEIVLYYRYWFKQTFNLFKNLRAQTKAPHLLAPFE